jgi:hypothetical protein
MAMTDSPQGGMEPLVAERRTFRTPPPSGMPPWLRRELIVYGSALAVGLLLMPFLIWMVGNRMLGAYTHGQNAQAGPFALVGDYFVGLAHGSIIFWAVALGPALLILFVRVVIALFRAIPAN